MTTRTNPLDARSALYRSRVGELGESVLEALPSSVAAMRANIIRDDMREGVVTDR